MIKLQFQTLNALTRNLNKDGKCRCKSHFLLNTSSIMVTPQPFQKHTERKFYKSALK